MTLHYFILALFIPLKYSHFRFALISFCYFIIDLYTLKIHFLEFFSLFMHLWSFLNIIFYFFIFHYLPINKHCVKSVQIRSFLWSLFSRIWTEYEEIRSISPYSVRIRKTADQKKLRIWTHFTQCSLFVNP